MVHNGIEYEVMVAYAEDFNITNHADAGTKARDADAETAAHRDPHYYRYDFNPANVAKFWRWRVSSLLGIDFCAKAPVQS